jgi:hypothetical protein
LLQGSCQGCRHLWTVKAEQDNKKSLFYQFWRKLIIKVIKQKKNRKIKDFCCQIVIVIVIVSRCSDLRRPSIDFWRGPPLTSCSNPTGMRSSTSATPSGSSQLITSINSLNASFNEYYTIPIIFNNFNVICQEWLV